MKVRADIQKRDDPTARVFVVLEVSRSETYSFQLPAMKDVIDKGQPLSPEFPCLTFAAIEAAFTSAIFFARHKAKVKALSVALLSFGMEGNVENPIPFAVATTVAIYEAVAGIRNFPESDLSGWEIVSCESALPHS